METITQLVYQTYDDDLHDYDSITNGPLYYDDTANNTNHCIQPSAESEARCDGNVEDYTYNHISSGSTQRPHLQRQEASFRETELKVVDESRQENSNIEVLNTTRLKSRDQNEENLYQHLMMSKRKQLVNLKTRQRDTESTSGVSVVEDVLYPVRSYFKTEKELVDNINSGDKAVVQELMKHVHTNSIPSAIDQKDLPALCTLSDCYGIERRAAREIQNVLFNTEVDRHDLDALLESVELLLGVVRRRAASPDTLKHILPNVIVLLVLVHHLLLSHHNKQRVADTVNTRLRQFDTLLEEIEYPQTEETEKNLLKVVRILIADLGKVLNGNKANRLQIGCWKDALQKESCRSKLANSLTKMSTLEHCSLLVRLLIELHLRLVEKHMIFLLESLKSVKSLMKKADWSNLYPLLVIIFRGLVSILHIQQDHHNVRSAQDNIIKTCMEILKISLKSSKVSLECKLDLCENINSLLFHKSENVASSVSKLMSEEFRFCLADKVSPFLECVLEPLSFTMHAQSQERLHLPCWVDISGTIMGHKEVTVHVLLPANGTVRTHQSDIKDISTGINYNTLDILRTLLGNEHHPNIKRLIAFQLQTIPMFYMTEKLSDATLSTYLLRERKHRKWLSLRRLGYIALDCVKAIKFLHECKIIHRNITAASFSFRIDHPTLVLSDFSIAQSIDDGSSGSASFIQDIDGNLIPTRWSAPESLLDDRYDVMSDTWMLGHTLSEIFTHGCHPFSEMSADIPFDDLMDMVVFHDLKPHRYPCTPVQVHNVILQCVETKPTSRIKLKEIQENLEQWLNDLDSSEDAPENQSLRNFTNKSLNYPEIDPQQNEPERGSTKGLKQLKNMRGNPSISYYNRASKRRLSSYAKKHCITEQCLAGPDHPVIKEKGLYLEVEEPVTHTFLRDTFPNLCNKPKLAELFHIVTFPPDHHHRDSTNPDGLTHALSYRCKKADSLFNIAKTCMFGDPEDSDNQKPYLEVVYELVQFVNEMHNHGWILRDLCCSTLYRSQVHDKVFMPRLGRLLKIEKRRSRVEASIIDKTTCVDDRRNWMPAEVISKSQFSQASDIYMMAMTILQFYSLASLFKVNQVASRLEAVPFCKVEPDKLLEALYRGDLPEEADSCPSWLFKLLKECWNRDSTKRPTADYILAEIENRLVNCYESTFDSVSSEQTSGGSVCSSELHVHDTTPSDIKVTQRPMEETDRPIPPPRPKRSKNKLLIGQENEYFNVSKPDSGKSDSGKPESGQGNEYHSISDTDRLHSSYKTSVMDANALPVTYENIKQSLPATSFNTENVIPLTVASYGVDISCANSNDCSNTTFQMPIELDVCGYLDLDMSSNQESCVKDTSASQPSTKASFSAFQDETLRRTNFGDDCEVYQDFDSEEGSICVNRSHATETQRVTHSANEYDYATQFPAVVKASFQDRPKHPVPEIHVDTFEETASTRANSIRSSFSCANSEALEYDYVDQNPRSRNINWNHIDSGNSTQCSGESTISNGSSLSCGNSSTEDYMRHGIKSTPGLSRLHWYSHTTANSTLAFSHERNQQPLPQTRAGTLAEATIPMSRQNSSNSAFSCANSELSEYGYVGQNPLEDKWDVISSSSRSSGTMSGDAFSCANSSVDNDSESEKERRVNYINSPSSVYLRTIASSPPGPDRLCTVDDDGYEKPVTKK